MPTSWGLSPESFCPATLPIHPQYTRNNGLLSSAAREVVMVHLKVSAISTFWLRLDRSGLPCYNDFNVPLGGIRGDGEEGRVEQTEKARLISDFVNRRVWAVVGASQDRSKFGYQIFRSLHGSGYTVYPVNPRGGELEGARVYPTLADLPELPEVVDLVVPPSVTEQVVVEAHRLGLSRVWMQPGAESRAAIQYCLEHGIQVIYHACAMVHKRQLN
jgi:predicted CoA-binding protein